jgi:hypothetical protein
MTRHRYEDDPEYDYGRTRNEGENDASRARVAVCGTDHEYPRFFRLQ